MWVCCLISASFAVCGFWGHIPFAAGCSSTSLVCIYLYLVLQVLSSGVAAAGFAMLCRLSGGVLQWGGAQYCGGEPCYMVEAGMPAHMAATIAVLV